jgi:transcriptional regulator with GAF, ATPase, and Fis domain
MTDSVTPGLPPDDHSTAAALAAANAFDDEIAGALSSRTASGVRTAITMQYFAADTFDALDAFRGLLLSHSRFETLLQGLCEQAVAAIPGADMAGVTLLHHDAANPETAARSDSRVSDIDADQYRVNEGPCLEAARTGRIVCVHVEDAAARWPLFAAAASEAGVRSFLSAPLDVDSEHAGSLNIYSFGDHGFSDIDEVLVTVLVTAVEVAVWESRHTADAREESGNLRRAMETRACIEQAKGIVMAVRGITADAAFAALVEQSQRENVRVSVLAERTVTSVVAVPL